ncbi:MAG TPA: hypothetical protein VHH73_06095, partial [Verrucomicrobiae bacterium]|nr:hypothetical protein [Verrucomicrobiae bacterium]
VLVPAATRYWVNWTVPAAGFNLQTRDSFAPGTSWTDSTLTSTQIGNLVRVQIPATNAAGGSGFFRVIKP